MRTLVEEENPGVGVIPCPCEGLGVPAFEVDEAGVGEVWAALMKGKMLETRAFEE